MNLDPNNTFLLIAICLKADVPVGAYGPPGVGKTSGTPALAKSLGFLPSDDDGDFYDRAGLTTTAVSYLMPEDISGLASVGIDGTINRLHDSWIVKACETPSLLVMDEANRFVTTAVANVCLRLYQERMAGPRCLPPAAANRICHLEWSYDPSHTIDYFMGGAGNIPTLPKAWPEVTPAHLSHARMMIASFLRTNPLKALLEPKTTETHGKPWGRTICGPWASPRSWDNFARVIAVVSTLGDIRNGVYADIVHNLGLGLVGSVASEFYQFISKSDLRSGAEVLDAPGNYNVPARIDILWAETMSASVEARRRNTLVAWRKCLDIYRAINKYGMPEVSTVALPTLFGMNSGGPGASSVFMADLINHPDIRAAATAMSQMTGIYKS